MSIFVHILTFDFWHFQESNYSPITFFFFTSNKIINLCVFPHYNHYILKGYIEYNIALI